MANQDDFVPVDLRDAPLTNSQRAQIGGGLADAKAGRLISHADVVAGLEKRRQEYIAEAKLEALRSAIREGEESGIAPDGVFERVLAEIHKLPKDR